MLEKVLRESFESYMRGVHVAIPATVVLFDDKTQTLKVDIDILEQIGEENKSIATLEDVPYASARAGGFVITFPIEKGDKVQLLFQHRSIDKWIIDGEADSKDLRTHNINDAIASNLIAYPLDKAIEEYDTEALTIRDLKKDVFIKLFKDKIELSYKKQNYIKIEDENIEIKSKNIKLIGSVDIEGRLTVTKIIKSLSDVLAKGISLFSHLHGGVLPGPSKTTPPE